MMRRIDVGLTSVADHPTLASQGKASTLADLAGHLPVVELDTTFYALPTADAVRRWQQAVPASFQFIVKATQFMTRHKEAPDHEPVAEFTAWRRALAPLIEADQLAAALFQLPPYFGVTAENVRYLHLIRRLLPGVPVALEFRNDGWYSPDYRGSTLALMRELTFSHVVVDEPQTASGSVPLVAEVTDPALAIMRLHGRNTAGWLERDPQWRSCRTNYRYSDAELQALGQVATTLDARRVIVIFNNNGGHDAAANALAFIAQLGLQFDDLGPSQLSLF
ncbi:DUF72 domain-containing protein [Lacticaseibacillus absianus]|uniref:DUF72 domain-containing protein n=1 Tax=Lacticaseibacillus absianus TaxID=2729623 RepID=UPI0015CDE880|nr:DUF72 domain-containing protein [Lacticaseibacillus absianus]